MLLSQATQVPDGAVVLIGDSITDGMFALSCDSPVFNAGIGSTTVETWVDFAPLLLGRLKPKLVLIAVGVNNTSKKDFTIEAFERSYEQLCSIARQSGGHVVVSTILPVDKEKPLGARYFDARNIREANNVIRQVAEKNEYQILDSFSYFVDKGGYMPSEMTTDGVHLNASAYTKLKKLIHENVCD